MKNTIKKFTLPIFCLLFFFLFSNTGFATQIPLSTLMSTSLEDAEWTMGKEITIEAMAPYLKTDGPESSLFDFSPDANFYLEAAYDESAGSYSGFFSVSDTTQDYVYAAFNTLEVSIYPISEDQTYFVLETSDIGFAHGSAVDVNWNDITLFTGLKIDAGTAQSFLGRINGDSLIIPNPEPATLMLFGFGLLGIAGLGRKRWMGQA